MGGRAFAISQRAANLLLRSIGESLPCAKSRLFASSACPDHVGRFKAAAGAAESDLLYRKHVSALLLANQIRHIKKKRIRDLNHRIEQVKNRMHNKKAKRDVPRLQAELNALFKEKDEAMRGNLHMPKKPSPLRLCPACHERLGRGYHICKAMPVRNKKD